MVSLYNIGLSYLSQQSSIPNGGITGLLLNNIQFDNGAVNTNNLQKIGLWTSYLSGFLLNTTRPQPVYQNNIYQLNNFTNVYNPNRPITAFMIIWLISLLILVLVIVITSIVQLVKNKRDKKEVKYFKFLTSRVKGRMINRSSTRKVIILASMCFIVALWTIFLILLCSMQYIVQSKFINSTTNSSSQQYSSLSDAISSSFSSLNSFFNVLSNQTNVFISSGIVSMTTIIKNQLSTSIVAFGSQVLSSFNITALFKTAHLLLDSLNLVVASMTYINANCQNILSQIDNTKGSVSVYQSTLANVLNNTCVSLASNPSMQNICLNLKAQNTFFRTNIKTGDVSSKSSVIMVFVMQQYNINITQITTSFYKIDSDFQSQLSGIFNSTVNQFDIASYLDIISTAWNSVIGMISPSFNTTNSYSTAIGSALNTAAKYENLITILLIFFIVLTLLFVVLLSFRDAVQERSLNGCLNLFVQLVFTFVLLVSTVLCIVLLIFSNFTQSEICNQLNTTAGVTVLDEILNNVLSNPWNSLQASVTSLFPSTRINLPQPMNILSGVTSRCRNSSKGLFGVLGMSNFVNVSEIVWSNATLTVVYNARKSALESFLIVNPQQIIPPDISSFFQQTSSLATYFDGIDYSAGIQQLNIPLVGITNFSQYFQDLSNFAINASKVISWTSDLIYLNDTANKLISIAPSWAQTQDQVNTLSKNFQILQYYRNNSFLLNSLKSTITSVQNLFNNTNQLTTTFNLIYNQMIAINLLNDVTQLMTTGINVMISQMIPCNDLSMIYDAISTTVCSTTNFNVSLATFSVVLIIEIVFCQIVSILVITAINLRLSCEENVSKC